MPRPVKPQTNPTFKPDRAAQQLISVALAIEGAVPASSHRALLSTLGQGLPYLEILLFSAAPASPAWQQFVKAHPNCRFIQCVPLHEESLFQAALEQAIGDILIILKEVPQNPKLVADLLPACEASRPLLFAHDEGHAPWAYSLLSGFFYSLLRAVSGLPFQSLGAVMVLHRVAMLQLLNAPLSQRLGLLLNLQTGLPSHHVVWPEAARRPWHEGVRRMGRSLQLALLQGGRVGWALSLACWGIALLSAGAVCYALVVWLMLPAVASGWTSQLMLLGALFAALFTILGVMVQMLLVLLREVRQAPPFVVVQELTHTDLFRFAPTQNVTKETA